MYLEQFKDKDVVIICSEESPSKYDDYMFSQIYKLTELAKFLGAKTVTINSDTEDKHIIRYYNEDNGDINCKAMIEVFWDDLNEALALETIYYENNLIGFLEYNEEDRVAEINEVLGEENYLYFDIKLSNYDFTSKTIEFDIDENGNEIKVCNFKLIDKLNSTEDSIVFNTIEIDYRTKVSIGDYMDICDLKSGIKILGKVLNIKDETKIEIICGYFDTCNGSFSPSFITYRNFYLYKNKFHKEREYIITKSNK